MIQYDIIQYNTKWIQYVRTVKIVKHLIFTDKIDLKGNNKYVALSNYGICYT